MAYFIKAGYWEKLKKGYKGWLNLDDVIRSVVPASTLTTDELEALQGANSPGNTNVFATMGDVPTSLSELSGDTTHRVVTDAEKITWNAKQNVLFSQYLALFTQTSTNAPTINLLVDDFSVPTLARTAAGTYTITKTGAFTQYKTTPYKLQTSYDSVGNKITIEWTSVNVITLKTYGVADTAVLLDGCLDHQEVNIKVYL